VRRGRGPLTAAGGLKVRVPHGLKLLERADTIVIPGWRDVTAPPAPALLAKLRAAHARGARLCSICSGVFVLAAAGVLEGRRATTHWRYVERLAAQYPGIRVEPNALYVDEGNVLTSAGSAAGLDMLLHLVRRDYGPKIANQVAQRLVIAPHREGGQAQFVPRPVASDERGRLSRLLDFIRAHLGQPHTLRSLAARAAMSTRTLQREFTAATGQAPYAWLVSERIARAKGCSRARGSRPRASPRASGSAAPPRCATISASVSAPHRRATGSVSHAARLSRRSRGRCRRGLPGPRSR
jgi:AraC family transcriptional activator FtrA